MKKDTLSKRNLLIALAVNLSLMAVSYRIGFCIDYAIMSTLAGGVTLGGFLLIRHKQEQDTEAPN